MNALARYETARKALADAPDITKSETLPVGLALPESPTFEEWANYGRRLGEADRKLQWLIGEWWNNESFEYGARKALVESEGWTGPKYQTCRNAASIAAAFELSRRRDNLTFHHHAEVAALPQPKQEEWLDRAESDGLSVLKLRAAIRQGAAVERTKVVEFNAKALSRFAVIYADPPWRYENPPVGVGRAIENQYPTMTLEDICKLPVRDIAHENAILFIWATAPKLYQCMKVIDAWGFEYRTGMVWAKDKIGMGYYVRNQHEHLLICKRGDMPHPPESARCSSLVTAPRLGHSAKPAIFYDLIDRMYSGLRKIELFSRSSRKGWAAWGNQAAEP